MIRLFKVGMSPAAIPAVAAVLESGYVGQGPRVDEFERRLSDELGMDVLTVNSCTSALDLALHLIGVGPGDEVISTAQTCTATNGVIVNRHASIVWGDIDPVTGNIDPKDVAKKITRRTKAIMAVDWGGRLCDYVALKSFGIPVIEDAAHAYLAHRADDVRGDYICWSFQAIKHLTTGDGGAISTPPEQTDRARLLRWYGLDRRGPSDSFRCAQTIEEAGFKYHMNDIAAAIGLANLELARVGVASHRANAAWYEKNLANNNVTAPPPDAGSAWWLYTILVEDRDRFIVNMKECGVECSPVHARNDKHPAFRGYSGPLPGLDYFASREVAIPVGWWLSPADLEVVAATVRKCA